jgi:hypothetical protein
VLKTILLIQTELVLKLSLISDQIKSLPSLSRNIADFARLTPQAQISGDDVLSIGGQNNRYNAIYIDGAVNNDVLDYLQTVLMVVKQELVNIS